MADQRGSERLSVLHVILNLGETNGQYNEHCLPLMHERDIAIATYFEPQLTPPAQIDLFAGDGRLFGFIRALRAALDARAYDVIHVHAPQTGAIVPLALMALFRYRRLRPSMVYTVQDSFYDYRPRNQMAMILALVGFKLIIFCSRAAYDSVPRVWRWLVRRRWRVVQNAADIDRVDRVLATRPSGRGNGAFTVLSVGRLEPVKDPLALIDAFATATDDTCRLEFVGAGSLEPLIRAHVLESDLRDQVLLTGLVPRDAVFERCADADVMVSTSHGEGLPVAVIEAMAAGCPVILSDIAPHRELADGAGFVPLVGVGDTEGFAREIRRYREMSPTERRELGQRCREHVVARYTLPIMHAGTEAVYRELPGLAGAPASRR